MGPVTAETITVADCRVQFQAQQWTPTQYMQCRTAAAQQRTATANAAFAEIKRWLHLRGLDVTDDGVIVDGQGRNLAELKSEIALTKARIEQLRLERQVLDDRYNRMLDEFETYLISRL